MVRIGCTDNIFVIHCSYALDVVSIASTGLCYVDIVELDSLLVSILNWLAIKGIDIEV